MKRTPRPTARRRARANVRRALIIGVLPVVLLPATAHGEARVRFIPAVATDDEAELSIVRGARTVTIGSTPFGKVSRYASVPSGRVSLRAQGAGGGTDPQTRKTLADGRDYTVVSVTPMDKDPVLRVWPEASRPDGKTLVRVVHMAPELGSPDLVLDGKRVIRAFPFGRKTPYVPVDAGSHMLGAQRPNSSSTLISAKVDLRKGTASSAYVIGGGGMAVQAVLTSDARTVRTAAQAPAGKRRGTAVHVVRPGESLWKIAEKLLGSAASDRHIANEVQRIWDLNSVRVASGDPDVILPGLRLKLR